jgi:hypothetical protein
VIVLALVTYLSLTRKDATDTRTSAGGNERAIESGIPAAADTPAGIDRTA